MKRNVANLFVLVLLMYSLSYSVFGGNFLVTRFCSHMIRIWSLVCLARMVVSREKLPFFIKSLLLLYLMFVIYGLVQFFQNRIYYAHEPPVPISGLFYIFNISISILPIFVFYYYSRSGGVTKVMMAKRIPLFLLVITIGSIFNLLTKKAVSGEDEITNNFGYTFLSIIPMIMFLKQRSKTQFVMLGYCLLMILLCMKRGAMIIALILMGVYTIFLFKGVSRLIKIRLAVLVVVFSLTGLYVVNRMISSSDYFQKRVNDTMEGNSSGRDEYYAFFIDYYLNHMNEKEFLIGMGANATLGIWHNYAHNDWLEIAINQGQLGLIVYLIYWIAFLQLCFKRGLARDERTALWMLFIIYFMQTIFSMSYTEYNLYSSLVLGYCIVNCYPNVNRTNLKPKKI